MPLRLPASRMIQRPSSLSSTCAWIREAERIAEHDFAMIAATQVRGGRPVQQEILAGTTSDGPS